MALKAHSNELRDGSSRLGRCVIVNAYSYRNAGDAAIMLATRDLLVDLGAEGVILSSRYDDTAEYASHGINVHPELIPFPASGAAPRIVRALNFAVACFGVFLLLGVERLSARTARKLATLLFPESSRTLALADTLVIAGGGYMYSSKRKFNFSLYHSLLSVRYGQLFLGKTLMMPQSIGPVTRKFDAWLISWALKRTRVVVRETESLKSSDILPALGRLSVVDDVAFYRALSPLQEAADLKEAADDAINVVRIVAMDWRWSTSSNASRFDNYVAALASIADYLSSKGHHVILGGHSFLPEHDQNDIEIAQMIAERCRHRPAVDENTDVDHLYESYRRSRLVIGTRLHSCIMAISQGTPIISLGYQQKSQGVLGRVGLSEYVHQVSEVDIQLICKQADELLLSENERWDLLAERTRQSLRENYQEMTND